MNTSFPAESLVPKRGEIFCYLFENRRNPLRLYWGVVIEFERIEFEMWPYYCVMTCEWMPWSLHDWRELDGRRLQIAHGDQRIDSTLCAEQRDISRRTRLAIKHREANLFHVELEMLVDFHGYYGFIEPAMPVHAATDIPFIGLVSLPCHFMDSVPPSDLPEIASRFIDLSAYEPPRRWYPSGTIFRPRGYVEGSSI